MRRPFSTIAIVVATAALMALLGAESARAEDAPAKVHGAVIIGGKPRPNERVSIFHLYPSQGQPTNTQTDAQGRYAFDAVDPGEILIGFLQQIHIEAPGMEFGPLGFYSYTRVLQIESGRNYTINFGGAGRKVIGRMVSPAGLNIAWQYIPNRFITSTIKRPTAPRNLVGPALDDWWKAYRRSSENADLENSTQSIVVEVDKDGAFYADDVPPGQYRLEIQFPAPNGPKDNVVATVKHVFSVPDTNDTAPLDLGKIPVLPNGAINVGDAAPDFTVTTFDGKQVSLKTLRGKYVLLNFWATWCDVCHQQFPLLQSIQAKWGKDDRFAMLGISLDDDKATATTDAVFTKAPWPQALAGDPEKDGLGPKYGVYAVPEYFLIDPNGKLLVVHCYDDSIQSAVGQALAK